MATDSSHRVIMGENGVATFSRLFSSIFHPIFFIIAGIKDILEKLVTDLKFGQIPSPTGELAAL